MSLFRPCLSGRPLEDVREQEEDNGGVHVEVLYGGDCGEDCSGGVGAEVPRGGGQGLQDPVAGCGGGEEGEAGVIAEVFKVALEVTFATKTVEGEGSCYNRYPKQIPIV